MEICKSCPVTLSPLHSSITYLNAKRLKVGQTFATAAYIPQESRLPIAIACLDEMAEVAGAWVSMSKMGKRKPCTALRDYFNGVNGVVNLLNGLVVRDRISSDFFLFIE